MNLKNLKSHFKDRLQVNQPLARYTAARVGGPAAGIITANTADELAEIVQMLWDMEMPYYILGGGSNVLVSDQGINGVVVLNRAKQVRFELDVDPPTVWAEAGANFGVLARQAASKGLGGLAWAAGIPGTVGGAVVGNAGAHDGDMAGNLILAEILHRDKGRVFWTAADLGFTYRSSVLKQQGQQAVVLGARLALAHQTPEKIQAQMDAFLAHRRKTQPPGASMGSMFKNPPGDYAGRLIEQAGLKGTRCGDAEISTLHANFFVNLGSASAADVYHLIQIAQETVQRRFGIMLELEIELLGDW